MKLLREPRIHPVSIAALRPTQITVGMREVKVKRKSWREHPDRKKPDFLGKHLIPVIWGPKEEYYVIDHHHLTLALHQEGVENIATTVVADLRRLPRDAFWVFLDNRCWLHPSMTRVGGAATRMCRSGSWPWSTIRIAVWQANCAGAAVLQRTRRRSANSCGRTSCVAGSSASWWRMISPRP